MANAKRKRAGGSTKSQSGDGIYPFCRDPEVPDLDDNPARHKDKTLRLHALGAEVSACFAACTGSPNMGADYIDPRIALAILLDRLAGTNLELVRAQGSGLAKKIGVGSGARIDEMAKRVAWSFYQSADHDLRLQSRFMDLVWSLAHRLPGIGDGGGFCDQVEIPDLGDPAREDQKLERLHLLGKAVSEAFSKCTGTDPASADYIDPRIALAILLVYLASTNRDLINAQGSALGGNPGRGSAKPIDDSAKIAAQRFLDDADHNVRMHVRYKSLRWVAAQKATPASGRSTARKARRTR
ncbi:MAG: hypothetical protein ACREQR_01820 [Candidatus Binataceae bacterium]